MAMPSHRKDARKTESARSPKIGDRFTNGFDALGPGSPTHKEPRGLHAKKSVSISPHAKKMHYIHTTPRKLPFIQDANRITNMEKWHNHVAQH